MKYKLYTFLRFITGFLFYLFFFIASYKSLANTGISILYLGAFISSVLYLFFSYKVTYYNMHYFFEFKKELILKIILILSMFGIVLMFYKVFPFILGSEKRGLIILFFLGFYVAFEVISELAIITTSYKKSIDMASYEYKMIRIYEQEESCGKSIYKKTKHSFITRFINKYIQLSVYNCFVDHEGNCYGLYDDAFYSKLINFSKENQRFYNKKIENNSDYILDCRCNVICIKEQNFILFDHSGTRCVFVNNLNKHF